MKKYIHLISFKTEKQKVISLCAFGMLSAFAMAPYYIVPFLCVGLSILFYQINHATKCWRAGLYAGAFGFGFGATSMAWLSNALMIDNGSVAWAIPLCLLGMGLLFGIFYALPALMASLYRSGWRRFFTFAAWFVVFEWIRSWIFTGFPWNLIGSCWGNILPILQTTSIIGIYGLSFITILVCSSGAFLPKYKPILIAGCSIVVITLLGAWRLYDASNDNVWGVQLRLVQPNIAQSLKWDPDAADENYSKILRLSRENNEKITHVIWPEAAVHFLIDQNEGERLRMMGAVRQGGTLITGGLRGANPHKRQLANSIFVLDDLADIKGYYDKSHLVPFGEYIPFREIIPLDKIVPIGGDLQKGNGLKTIHIPKAPPASPLVCYEAIFSGQVVRQDKRPSWMINVSNDAWYGLSAGPYQHFDMARLRAIEEGLPMVRAANNGISAIIDGYGRIVNSLDLGEAGVVDGPLPKALPATIYAKTGPYPILLLSLIIIVFCIKRRK